MTKLLAFSYHLQATVKKNKVLGRWKNLESNDFRSQKLIFALSTEGYDREVKPAKRFMQVLLVYDRDLKTVV